MKHCFLYASVSNYFFPQTLLLICPFSNLNIKSHFLLDILQKTMLTYTIRHVPIKLYYSVSIVIFLSVVKVADLLSS